MPLVVALPSPPPPAVPVTLTTFTVPKKTDVDIGKEKLKGELESKLPSLLSLLPAKKEKLLKKKAPPPVAVPPIVVPTKTPAPAKPTAISGAVSGASVATPPSP